MANHDVEFYIPDSEVVPTKLRLLVDGKHIPYTKLTNQFGYDFEFNNGETDAEAFELANYLAQIMCDQSYDHGSEWRVTSITLLEQSERFKIGEIVRVLFRVKDSY